MNTNYRSSVNPNVLVDINTIKQYAENKQRIDLIKLYRSVTGKSLHESKDAVEKHELNDLYDIKGLINEFTSHMIAPDPFTKEEFLNIISEAIDSSDKFFCTDMLDAVLILCNNIKSNGGLIKLAEKRSEFLQAL
jgi:hypothetical protein